MALPDITPHTFEQFNISNKCPKCEGGSTTKYDSRKDLMFRHCLRCSYFWYELPKDRKGK